MIRVKSICEQCPEFGKSMSIFKILVASDTDRGPWVQSWDEQHGVYMKPLWKTSMSPVSSPKCAPECCPFKLEHLMARQNEVKTSL
jgi:hypothetical protein